MWIDVKSSAPTPAPARHLCDRARDPPSADIHNSRPDTRNADCSINKTADCARAAWCSAGRCHPQTATSSSNEAGIGAKSCGQRGTGSRRVFEMPAAISGAQMATTVMCSAMWAENECRARWGSGPSHAAARAASGRQ